MSEYFNPCTYGNSGRQRVKRLLAYFYLLHGRLVFSVQEMASIYPDRVVAIRGPTVDNMSNAEVALSAKLRECHQRDYVSMTRVRYVTLRHVITLFSSRQHSPYAERI